MKKPSLIVAGSLAWALAFSPRAGAATHPAPPRAAHEDVSGTIIVDGKTVALRHAYVDETDPQEPIVVLSDRPLPGEAVPFVPEKLVKEKQLYAVAFSVSRKDRKLTNTFGKLYAPGHEIGVGFGRVEDGNVTLAVDRLDSSGIAGRFATVKPVKLSYVTYSFDLRFQAGPGSKK